MVLRTKSTMLSDQIEEILVPHIGSNMMSQGENDERQKKVIQACITAEEFTKHYFDRIDTRRHTIGKLYLDSANLFWNGNKMTGPAEIQQFFLDKVPTTEHILTSLDAQPVLDSAVAGQTTISVQVCGGVKYLNHQNKPFQQTFLLTADNDKWKIVTDVFRCQEYSAKTQAQIS